jgi:hypothetical protein
MDVADVLRHSFGFLSLPGLWCARQVCRLWLQGSRKARVDKCRMSLTDWQESQRFGIRLRLPELTVCDDSSRVETVCVAPGSLQVGFLTLEFAKLDLKNVDVRAFQCLFEATQPAEMTEVRFRFSSLHEYCTEAWCYGALCDLLRTNMPALAHCVLELPWSFDGTVSQDWCCYMFDPGVARNWPTTWRLRDSTQNPAGKTMTAFACVCIEEVDQLILQEVDFREPANAQVFARIEASGGVGIQNVRRLTCVNCFFPPPRVWPEHFGFAWRYILPAYELFLADCNVSTADVKAVFPNARIRN